MLAKGRVFALAAGVTIMVVAWGVLVFLAIDHGRAPRDSAQDWLVLVGATVGAVACMFLAILSAARLRDLLRDGRDYDEDDDSPSGAVPMLDVDEVAAERRSATQGWIPAQRTADSTRYVATNGRGRVYAEDEDDSSFLSYAGQGETADRTSGHDVADEPQWANETGEQYYRDLGQRSASRHSAPNSSNGSTTGTTDDPPSSVPYATPGKRALR